MYFEDYYPNANSDTTALSSSANSAGASINVTKVFEYFATHPSAVSRGFMMYVTPSTTISNPQSSFGVYQVEESDSNVCIILDYGELSGSYYVNSLETGKFLSVSAGDATQSIYSSGLSKAWDFTYVGNNKYILNVTGQPNNVLAMSNSCDVFIGNKSSLNVNNYTWQFTFQANYALLYNVGAGEYLYPSSNGSISSTMEPVGAEWRFCKTSAYVPLTDFSVADIVMDVGENVTFEITEKEPLNSTWINWNDFEIDFNSNKIELVNNQITALAREHTYVIVTHKPTGKEITFDVFVKNSILTNAEKELLIENFENEIGNVRFSVAHPKYLIESLKQVLEYDYTITRYCNMYKIPKEFVQTVLLRELWCYNDLDIAADVLVIEYYDWKYHGGTPPAVQRTDSSTGIAQIFANTAIHALNNADDRGFLDLAERYDPQKWQDVWATWSSMHYNTDVSIRNCALVILNCQYEFSEICPYWSFYSYNNTQIKKILARYNGYGDEAQAYGEDCFEFFSLFREVNEVITNEN